LARTRSIKVLDYAMQTEDGSKNCERFVEVLGLKTFFSAFMGKVSPTSRVRAGNTSDQ
jgi:beta-catenin-like protein 1